MLDRIQNGLRRKKKGTSLLQMLLRISFVIGLGTTGKRAVAEVRRMVPSLRGSTIAIDGEVSREEEMEDDDQVVVPNAPVADFRSRKDSIAFLSTDPLISTVRFPYETEKGAGTCRLNGTLKGEFVLEQFTRKLNRSLRRRLAKIQDQDQRPVIDVHIVAAAGGGLGSAAHHSCNASDPRPGPAALSGGPLQRHRPSFDGRALRGADRRPRHP